MINDTLNAGADGEVPFAVRANAMGVALAHEGHGGLAPHMGMPMVRTLPRSLSPTKFTLTGVPIHAPGAADEGTYRPLRGRELMEQLEVERHRDELLRMRQHMEEHQRFFMIRAKECQVAEHDMHQRRLGHIEQRANDVVTHRARVKSKLGQHAVAAAQQPAALRRIPLEVRDRIEHRVREPAAGLSQEADGSGTELHAQRQQLTLPTSERGGLPKSSQWRWMLCAPRECETA